MKIKIGSLTVDQSKPTSHWENVKSMSTWEFQIRSIPTGVLTALVIGWLWHFVMPVNSFIAALSFPVTSLVFALCLVGTLVIHELLHVAGHPRNGNPNDSILGLWPSKMFLYAQYNGEMTRLQSLIILLLPFILISILPLLIGLFSSNVGYWIVYISTVNAFLSGGDLYLTFRTFWELPSDATVKFSWWINNQ